MYQKKEQRVVGNGKTQMIFNEQKGSLDFVPVVTWTSHMVSVCGYYGRTFKTKVFDIDFKHRESNLMANHYSQARWANHPSARPK